MCVSMTRARAASLSSLSDRDVSRNMALSVQAQDAVVLKRLFMEVIRVAWMDE